MRNLEDRLKKLPDKPGVYLMKDIHDEVIYVGKAISLKKRVRQYFQSSRNNPTKVNAMIRNIADFEYIIVDNEVEALILESNLIKEYRPKYNILLRDDKQYPYIKVNLNESFPRVMKVRNMEKDSAKYFGPYPSVTAVNDALEIIEELYPIRTCSRNLSKDLGKTRPCLNYFIGRCLGPCQGNIPEEEYLEMIDDIVLFLEGDKRKMISELEEKMFSAAENMAYEEAGVYRDKIESLKLLDEQQKINSTTNATDRDVIGIARGIEEVCIQIFFIRSGKILGREHYFIENTFQEESNKILSSFIKQFYIGSAFIPKEILLEKEVEDIDVMESWLSQVRGNKVSITIPKKGENLRLVELVKKNALDMLSKYGDRFIRKNRENQRALDQLKEKMNLDFELNRIEAFDISNINGTNPVGSMVVFEKGESKKSDYRRFKIKTVYGPDDYKSMEEVLMRRFKRGLKEREFLEDSKGDLKGFSSFPDLIMMDGGKGQVNVALRVLYDLGIDIPVCGLVKDEFHNTRGIIYGNEEINLEEDSLAFRLIYKIQEEAHRFAISYHRSLRSKDMFKSELDGIKGIGPKRKKELLKHFKSIEKIKKARLEELLEVDSMNISSAESLYYYFNPREED